MQKCCFNTSTLYDLTVRLDDALKSDQIFKYFNRQLYERRMRKTIHSEPCLIVEDLQLLGEQLMREVMRGIGRASAESLQISFSNSLRNLRNSVFIRPLHLQVSSRKIRRCFQNHQCLTILNEGPTDS